MLRIWDVGIAECLECGMSGYGIFFFFFSILYFTSVVIVYNSYIVQNNILIKIDGMVYSYIVEITNSYKHYIRNKLNLATCTN